MGKSVTFCCSLGRSLYRKLHCQLWEIYILLRFIYCSSCWFSLFLIWSDQWHRSLYGLTNVFLIWSDQCYYMLSMVWPMSSFLIWCSQCYNGLTNQCYYRWYDLTKVSIHYMVYISTRLICDRIGCYWIKLCHPPLWFDRLSCWLRLPNWFRSNLSLIDWYSWI